MEEFKSAIKKRQPHKIDIGAVFTAPPKDHNNLTPDKFKPQERELVFDIDMTDYDPVRTCCTGANICMKCWPFMTMALKCVDKALRDDFNFKHILWIYSGRRGVHCWVNDVEARQLSNEARSAVVEYLSVEVEGNESKLRSQVSPQYGSMHPHLRRSYNLLEPYFRNYIADNDGQGLLATKKSYRPLLNAMPDDTAKFRTAVDNAWNDETLTGAERWDLLLKMIEELKADSANASSTKKRKFNVPFKDIEGWKTELVFKYTYPRLDANVSKAMNHLLKSPFCVHPKTGRVCIPIDPATADDFNPFSVPTVRTLCEQIDTFDRLNPDKASSTFEFEKTDLKDALSVFKASFWRGMESAIKEDFQSLLREKRDDRDMRDAMSGEF